MRASTSTSAATTAFHCSIAAEARRRCRRAVTLRIFARWAWSALKTRRQCIHRLKIAREPASESSLSARTHACFSQTASSSPCFSRILAFCKNSCQVRQVQIYSRFFSRPSMRDVSLYASSERRLDNTNARQTRIAANSVVCCHRSKSRSHFTEASAKRRHELNEARCNRSSAELSVTKARRAAVSCWPCSLCSPATCSCHVRNATQRPMLLSRFSARSGLCAVRAIFANTSLRSASSRSRASSIDCARAVVARFQDRNPFASDWRTQRFNTR
mmetsp:Transcript_14279/g.50837  ORF Transcript_14279/g.50837 Transcript_14279/m.50837 type:complete len:273 (-) Transcript_14279:650-1468(-)